MLGTSARIGEVLAIRRWDLDITSAVPSIHLAGTIISRNGEQTFRQDHPKTAKSRRAVALPTFIANASIELAAELIGHADTKITVQHYIQRSEPVNPATSALLDRAFAKDQE